MDTVLQKRIRSRLNDLGISARAASIRAGLGPDAIRTILDGRSVSPRAERLQRIAAALQVDLRYLVGAIDTPFAEEAPDIEEEALMLEGMKEQGQFVKQKQYILPVTAEVAAGAWLATDEVYTQVEEMREVAFLSQYVGYEQWLERARGPSMNKLGIVDGCLLHVVNTIQFFEPRHGDLVIVVRFRAQGAFRERSVKQVVASPSGIQLVGCSYDPLYNVPLSLTSGLKEDEDDVTVAIVGQVVRAYIDFR